YGAAIIVPLSEVCFAGMYSDADAHRCRRGPWLSGDGFLQSRSCAHGVGGPGEDGKAAVPLSPRPHDATSMPGNYIFNYLVVTYEGCAGLLRISLPKLSTPLYIGKEEGYRARWQVGHIRSHSHSHDHSLIENQTQTQDWCPPGQA